MTRVEHLRRLVSSLDAIGHARSALLIACHARLEGVTWLVNTEGADALRAEGRVGLVLELPILVDLNQPEMIRLRCKPPRGLDAASVDIVVVGN